MSESEMNMQVVPVSPHQHSPSPSQLHSISPEIYALYPSKLARRMQEETCYKCKQKGHWSWDCPLNSPNAKSLSPSPNHGSLSPYPSTPPSQPQSKVHSVTPEIYACYPAKLARRMQEETCYRCNQIGHWSWDCPLSSPNANSLSPSPSPSPSPNHGSLSPVRIWCRCGHGFCEVKTALNDRNRGKKYYACPIKRGKKCSDFVKWCDGGNIDESYLRPPLYKYPECECGAGVCRKEKGTERPYGSEYYFTCPVRENHGSCGYRVWEDELLNNNKGIVLIQQSSQRTHVFLEDHQNEESDNDLINGGDLLKRMRVMDNSENPSLVVESPEKEDASVQAAPSKCVGFSDFEVADYLKDLEFANSVSWEAIKEEPFLLSRLSTPSRIFGRQSLLQGHIFADASFGVFPSFNPIDVPKQVSIDEGPCENSQLADNSLSEKTQISSGCDIEVSRDAVMPNKSPASGRKPMSKAERQRKLVLFAQQQLLNDLESLDPNEHESMREAAEATFDMLDNLGVNYKQFSEHVWDYIDLASSMAEMDKSMEISLTLDEYNKRFEEEKARLARVQEECSNTEALLVASNQCRQTLIEEISHLEAMLYEKQTQLKSCELENLQIETHLGELRRGLMEPDKTLMVARQLHEERQAKQISAKTALEKAKLELEN